MILCAGILVSMAGVCAAQAKNSSKKQSADRVKTTTSTKTDNTSATTLTSTGEYPALGSPGSRLFISDPTVRTLNARANGQNIRVSGSGVVGMPRGSYGFANGKISLLPRGSRTSGTQTGNGSVGSGTSAAAAGASGPAMGLNGKNPYAGTEIWPSTYRTLNLTDSTNRKRN